jgi:outer membrane immunogenic protein
MKHLLIAAAVLGFASTAHAADFTGPRVELRTGWDRVSIDGLRSANPATANVDAREDGITYGLALGYDHALSDRVIVGVEAAVDLSDNEFSGTVGTLSYDVDAKRDIELAARIGTKLTDSILLYGKVGYSNARVQTRLTSGATTLSESSNGDGVRVGGGLEVALTDQVYAKAEYRYTNYEAGVSRNQVLTGIGFRF